MLRLVNRPQVADPSFFKDIYQEFCDFFGIKNNFEVGVFFSDISKIKSLNLQYRGKDSETNVLSFNTEKGGDIVICEEVIEEEAKKLGYKPKELAALYFIHGLLHICGYQHQNSQNRVKMEKVENDILKKMGIDIER